jgi:hypothetical protein
VPRPHGIGRALFKDDKWTHSMTIKLFHPATGLRDLTADTVGDLNWPDITSRDDDASPPDGWPVLTGVLGTCVLPSTADFLRAVHPGDTGFLEIRAFRKGKLAAPAKFIPLPLDDHGLADLQAYALTYGRHFNLYHAIASRRTNASGKLANCSELWALYIEIDFKRGVPLFETWTALKSFAHPRLSCIRAAASMFTGASPNRSTSRPTSGWAYLWLSDLAHRLGGEPESTEPARVLRIPDTLNLKEDYGPSAPVVTLLCADTQTRFATDDVIAVLGEPTRTALAMAEAIHQHTNDLLTDEPGDNDREALMLMREAERYARRAAPCSARPDCRCAMTNEKTARVLKSAARWLQRRAKARTAADTKTAYEDAIEILNRLIASTPSKTRTPKAAPTTKTESK